MPSSPKFGEADLTNCERELIHLAGSIQPHGFLLVFSEPDLVVLQASANAGVMLERPLEDVLGRTAEVIDPDLQGAIRRALATGPVDEPQPLRCRLAVGRRMRSFDGALHRHPSGGLIVELEPLGADAGDLQPSDLEPSTLAAVLSSAVQKFSNASGIGQLCDSVVQSFKDMTGYDRVMVYKFDSDGHGEIIAEARDPRLESLLGHHYPASDIPQRARELYLRNRVRVLVDSHYTPVPLEPRQLPLTGDELDMSLCFLRSMSPLHIQYLNNMGVTATLVVSLVREGRLWGLIACHHYSPRRLRYAIRAGAELLAEAISMRIAAIDNYAHAQVAMLVRRLEQRLIEATSTEGDWRLALFRNPRTLLQPLEATGAALFHDGEIMTAGDVPSTPELRALARFVDDRADESMFATSSIGRLDEGLHTLTPTASGVLAVRLSASRPDYLMWFRKEQLRTVTWAGDPHKPVIGDDPKDLSPRRSFAAWSEIVRGTALPWTGAEQVLARAIGASLVDIIVQVHAVRLLVAEHQLAQVRNTIQTSKEPVLIADASGRSLFANGEFRRLVGRADAQFERLEALADMFDDMAAARDILERLRRDRESWRGELVIRRGDGSRLPVTLRAEAIPGRDGEVLGFVLILVDLSASKRAAAARRQLEDALARTTDPRRERGTVPGRDSDAVISAIMANASLAAMDISDGYAGEADAPLFEELEASTRRATELYARIRSFNGGS